MSDMVSRVAPAALSCAAVLVISLAGCGGGDGLRAPWGRAALVLPGAPADVVTQLPAKPRQSYVHGSHTVCLDEPGEVEVRSVEFQSGDLEITAWAVQPTPEPDADGYREFAGDWRGATLSSRGIEDTGALTRVCADDGKHYEVVLELRAGESSTEGDQVVVDYTSDGRAGSLLLPDRVVLCVVPERPSCS